MPILQTDFLYKNKPKLPAQFAAGERDEVIDGVGNKLAREENGHFSSVEQAREEKGDEWSGFRYSL